MKKYLYTIIGIVALFIIASLAIVVFSLQAPNDFSFSDIEIEEGSTVKQVAEVLEEERIIKSAFWFTLYAVFTGKDSRILSGEYHFDQISDSHTVLRRLSTGDYGFKTVAITIPEGSTRKEIAQILERKILDFDTQEFMERTEGLEGYLFPDTYYFVENTEMKNIISLLSKTFDQKTSDLKEQTTIPFDQVVVMASIIEKEASGTSRMEVADILWKRIGINMALQVDAPFVYEREKGTFDLSTADLREDSEYNTYTRLGLTPTAIGNPGLEALEAAAFPRETDYLFFLTGRDGEMYYATTHDEHVRNKALYLR